MSKNLTEKTQSAKINKATRPTNEFILTLYRREEYND